MVAARAPPLGGKKYILLHKLLNLTMVVPLYPKHKNYTEERKVTTDSVVSSAALPALSRREAAIYQEHLKVLPIALRLLPSPG